MLFILKESFKLIARSKLSFVLNLISITLSVLLIVITALIIQSSSLIQNYLKENLSINVFLNEGIQQSDIKKYEQELNAKPFTSKINFISKDEAAKIFIEETGEDFRKILDYNPLPASFEIYINQDHSSPESLSKIIAEIKKYTWVNDVVSQQDFLQNVISYADKIKYYIFGFTALMIFVSIYLVFSTVKLILNSKYSELETMKLVGSKISTIKLPIILNIMLIGIIAGAISIAIIYFLFAFIKTNFGDIKPYFFTKEYYYLIILCIGPFIGTIVTIFSLRKISLKI